MATTRASRNIGLRTFYDPLNPPDAKPQPPSKLFPPDPYGRDAAPVAYSPGGGEVAPSDQRRGAEINVPLAPWDNAMPGPNSGPGGIGGDFRYPTQQVDERLLPAGAAVAAPAAPLPPPRPSGLGGVLSSAVAPAGRAAPAAAAPAAQPQSSMFTSIDRQNSGPNDRFRGGGTALNLSGLLGGLFGGGGPAPQPTPPPPPAPSAGPRGPARPDMSGISFDAEGNPSYDGLGAGVLSAPGLQQDPNLAGTVAKPNWWKPLR